MTLLPHLVRRHFGGPVAILILLLVPALVMPEAGPFMLAPILPALLIVAPPRATLHEAALPLNARALTLARLIALLLMVHVPLLLWLVALQWRSKVAWTGHAIFSAFAIGTLGVLLPGLIDRDQLRPASRARVLLVLGGLGAASALIIVSAPPAAASALFVIAIVTTSVLLWRGLPVTLLTAGEPAEVRGRNTLSRGSAVPDGVASWRALWRSLLSPTQLLFLGLMLLIGVLGTSWLLMLVTAALVGYAPTRVRMRWLQALPVSDRARLLALLLPTIIGCTLMLGIGQSIPIPYGGWRDSMGWNAPSTYRDGERYFDSPTRVSIQFWERAPGGRVPAIVAPWGETSSAYVVRLPGLTLYNPYSSVEASSPRFVDWQFARATRAVYGFSMPRAQYDAMESEFPARVTSRPSVRLLGAGVTLVFLLVVSWLQELAMWHRRLHSRPFTLLAPWLPLVALGPVMGLEVLYGARNGGQIVVPLVQRWLLQLSDTLAHSAPLALLLSTFAAATAYALLEWQFKRAEVAMKLVKTPG